MGRHRPHSGLNLQNMGVILIVVGVVGLAIGLCLLFPPALGGAAPRAELDDGARPFRSAGAVTGLAERHLDHLAFRARRSETGIGAAVVTAGYQAGHRSWDCIAGDPDEWRYLQVIGIDLGPFAGLPPEDIEHGIERFGATLPAEGRLHQLINLSPLHIDRHGTLGD